MTKTLGATYDGKTLCPDEPLDLEPNTHVRITIEMPGKTPDRRPGSLRELFGSVDLGVPTGTDNEQIDRDLAHEYAATHEDEG